MKICACSYGFHRSLAAGKHDMFAYIKDCKRLGCTHLQPWYRHLSGIRTPDDIRQAGARPDSAVLSKAEQKYLDQVGQAAADAGLQFECVLVDGAPLYAASEEQRNANYAVFKIWLAAARRLGAQSVRFGIGVPENGLTDAIFRIVCAGLARARDEAESAGLRYLIENHEGITRNPDELLRLLDAVPGVCVLYDTENWQPGKRLDGLRKTARYAMATHMKVRDWTVGGAEFGSTLKEPIAALKAAGYSGVWGVESTPPPELDEYEANAAIIAAVKRIAG